MSTYTSFKTDGNLETNGITLDFGTAGKIMIARAGGANKSFEKFVMEQTKPHRQAIAAGTMDLKVLERLTHEAYAKKVVLGWDGITDENEKPIPFSVDACIKLFVDLPELFTEVRRAANNVAHFRQEAREADAKNS